MSETIILNDNFDSEPPAAPTLLNWAKETQGGGNFSIVTPGANSTAQALRCSCVSGVSTAQFAFIQKTFAAQNEIHARVYFRAIEFPATLDGTPIDIRSGTASGDALAWTRINSAGLLSLYYNEQVNSQTSASGSITLSPNIWYFIELRVGCNTALTPPYNGWVELRVNSSLVASAYNLNNSVNTGTVGQATIAQFGSRYFNNTAAHVIDIDEVTIATPLATTWRLNVSTTGIGALDHQSQDVAVGQSVTVNVISGTLLNWIDNGAQKSPTTQIIIQPQLAGTTYTLVGVFSGGGVSVLPWYAYALAGVAVGGLALLVVTRKPSKSSKRRR